MHRKEQLQDLLFRTILHAAMITLVMAIVLVLAVVPAWAQNAVPPTAREAAAMPAFASRLHPSVTPQATSKYSASAPDRKHGISPLDSWTYENGPVNGTTDAWTINFGYVISDSFSANTVKGFDIWVWEFPGDTLSSLDWSLTSDPNGGTVYGSGTANGANLTDSYVSTNQYGFNIDKISVSGLNVSPGNGTGYLNLQNAGLPSGDPVYWDENSGSGCHSPGCPSQADDSAVGTIPSESFDLEGSVCNGGCCDNGASSPVQSSQPDGRGFQVLYKFTDGVDSADPDALALDRVGNIYGTASGWDKPGTVFKLSNNGSGWLFTLLYSSNGGPSGRLLGPDGTLYGTIGAGTGCNGQACVFNLKPPPTAPRSVFAPWIETPLYTFMGGADEVRPQGDLLFDPAGNIYGTGGAGGAFGYGGIYRLTPSIAGWTESVLYSFTASVSPSGVVMDKDGNLYGTTFSGGDDSLGSVFQLKSEGGGWTYNTLHDFTYGSDGGFPLAALTIDDSGNLYGATTSGGDNFSGTVFRLAPSNSGWIFSVLHAFDYGEDGPSDRLVLGADEILYGATGPSCARTRDGECSRLAQAGRTIGTGNRPRPDNYQDGRVFMMSTRGDYLMLQQFCANQQGSVPSHLILDSSGNIYGTAMQGPGGWGLVWEISR